MQLDAYGITKSNPRLRAVRVRTIANAALAVLLSALVSARGQAPAAVTASGKRYFHAELSALGETAVVRSDASGTVDMVLNLSHLKLTWRVLYSSLDQPIRISLNGPAQAGTNGVVQVNLAPKGLTSPVQGSAILNEALVQYMLSGWTYVDIATHRYPQGEIRGRLAVHPAPRKSANEQVGPSR